ncbi:hypothetical protein G6O69_32225 [Pseudenhygromyxa sp. WMMC2535]|uniref:DUF6918 family protein n=1 Tax=Pseudenhygromyxa sp. WMMC2535 TaxID=2712867 RepID=UPI001555A286|nr:hypothetical protein [Pseudenhygromyxa sp. WMMC2535]NVB42535.1 hypothetical protein [Pseudenhygromyxa sp. WMMC2535]
MASLTDQLLRPGTREIVVDSCCELVGREVEGKRGFSGAAVKAGFAVVTRVKPGFVREVVSKLLPEFAGALEPIYQRSAEEVGEGAAEGAVADAFVARVTRERASVAEALLGVTDRRIGDARPSIRKAYERLRPNALDNVEAALPGLLTAIRPHLD